MQVYEGDQPYVFVSYSHKDSRLVVPIITMLQSCGLRIWYDPGIEPGSDWPDYIAEHIDSCAAFLFFISGNASASPHCRQEVHRAIRKNKEILVAYLDNGEISPGLEMELARLQSLRLWNFSSSSDFAEAISSSRPMRSCGGKRFPGRPEAIAPDRPYSRDAQWQKPVQAQAKKRPVVAIAAVAVVALAIIGAMATSTADNTSNMNDAPVTLGQRTSEAVSLLESASPDETQYPAIEISSSEIVSYQVTGIMQTPTAEEDKKEPQTLRNAFSLLSFISNTGDKPIMINSTAFIAEEVSPIIEPMMRVEAITVGNELLVYAVNDGWGSYSDGKIELLGSPSNNTEKRPLSEQFASEMDYEAAPFGSGIIRLIGRYRIDIQTYKSVAHAIDPDKKSVKSDYDWTYDLYADIPGADTVPIGTLVCDSEDNLTIRYIGKGSAPPPAVQLSAVFDVDEGPSRIAFTSPESTPRIEDVFRIETTIAPTKSCSIRCRSEFTVAGDAYATEPHDVIVAVPIYEEGSIAGMVDGGCPMTRELAANPDASDAEIRQIAEKYLYNPEAFLEQIRSS